MSKIYFFVDGIKNGLAVLLTEDGEQKLTVGVSGLPDGTREGDWLAASLAIDAGRKERGLSDVEKILKNFRR